MELINPENSPAVYFWLEVIRDLHNKEGLFPELNLEDS